MKALSEMTDAELLALLPPKAQAPAKKRFLKRPEPKKPVEAPKPEPKPEPTPVCVTVDFKPEISIPEISVQSSNDNELIVTLLKGLQTIQKRILDDSSHKPEKQTKTEPDPAIAAMMKSILAVQERLTQKKKFRHTVERTPSGDIAEIISEEI